MQQKSRKVLTTSRGMFTPGKQPEAGNIPSITNYYYTTAKHVPDQIQDLRGIVNKHNINIKDACVVFEYLYSSISAQELDFLVKASRCYVMANEWPSGWVCTLKDNKTKQRITDFDNAPAHLKSAHIYILFDGKRTLWALRYLQTIFSHDDAKHKKITTLLTSPDYPFVNLLKARASAHKKRVSDLTLQTIKVPNVERSRNITRVLEKGTKKIFFKQGLDSDLLEIEAVISAYAVLILGPEHTLPKRVVNHPTTKERLGTFSKYLPNLQSLFHLWDIEENKDVFRNNSNLIPYGLAKIVAFEYFFAQDDLHAQNWLFNFDTQKFVSTDHDRMLWPITAKYFRDTKKPRLSDHPFDKCEETINCTNYSEDSFKITKRDIDNLPILKDAHPMSWPDRYWGRKWLNNPKKPDLRYTFSQDHLLSLSKDPEYRWDSYKTLITIAVVPPETWDNINSEYISSKKCRDKLLLVRKRQMELKTQLASMVQVAEYLFTRNFVNQIIEEFEAYNDYIKNSKCKSTNKEKLLVDIALVENNCKEIHETSIKNNACSIVKKLGGNSKKKNKQTNFTSPVLFLCFAYHLLLKVEYYDKKTHLELLGEIIKSLAEQPMDNKKIISEYKEQATKLMQEIHKLGKQPNEIKNTIQSISDGISYFILTSEQLNNALTAYVDYKDVFIFRWVVTSKKSFDTAKDLRKSPNAAERAYIARNFFTQHPEKQFSKELCKVMNNEENTLTYS